MTFDAQTTPTQLTIKQGTEVIDAYEAAAAASPDVAPEARIRLGGCFTALAGPRRL
jgi:hypothetical protein